MTDLLMGMDVGTTLCKAAVVTLDGVEVAHGQRRTPWTSVPTGAEIDPRALAEASVGAALDALTGVPEGMVRGIGVCSMGETGVMLDALGEPIAPGIAWHDSRGGPRPSVWRTTSAPRRSPAGPGSRWVPRGRRRSSARYSPCTRGSLRGDDG